MSEAAEIYARMLQNQEARFSSAPPAIFRTLSGRFPVRLAFLRNVQGQA